MSLRLERIVAAMGIRPCDRILEIGCGHGLAVALMAELLTTGSIVAIDRSARMIDAARRRNADLVRSRRVEFITTEFEEFDPGSVRFDKILAVRVGVFHREPERAREIALRWLTPNGEMFIEYDEPEGKKSSPTRRYRQPR